MVPANSTKAGVVPREPGGARHRGGNRAVTSLLRAGQSTLCGDVKSLCGGGGRRVGQEWVLHKGRPRSPTERGRGNTTTQDAGATSRGTRVSVGDKEEGGSEAREAARTAGTPGTRNQKVEDGRACAWGGSDNIGDGLASQTHRYQVPGQTVLNCHQVGVVSRSPNGLFAQQGTTQGPQ